MTAALTTVRGWGPHGVVLCASCRRTGLCRLGVTSEIVDGDAVAYELHCPREHEGGPNVAHGGWTAGVLDELAGHVVVLRGQLAVTGQLSVRFVRPVPVERPLLGRASLVRREGHRWFIEAQIVLASSGAQLAAAEAVLVARDADHFARHERWLAEQEGSA
ncbi:MULTISPECIES: PaaI family thioesterase [Frankia]|uniref:PaaI family thioesterase n=1 Tax=Frankia TaxID=1854 RepID=UPI00030BCC56|nr:MULTISPECIES: PaaI family thioesterase [Frankia]